MNFALTRLNKDPVVSAKVWMPLCDFIDAINISKESKEKLFRCGMDIIRKLESVKYHRDNLLRILNEEIAKRATQREPTNVTMVDLTTGAEMELEAFLMQGKSTLDVLVKILFPLVGIKLHSYGEGGDKVKKALRNNLKVEQLSRAANLLSLIEQNKEWIKIWLGAQRDTIAHYKPFISSGFVTPPIKDGISRHAPPATKEEVPFHELVTVLYENLLTFCEDFIALAVSITFPAGIEIGVLPENKRDKQFPRKYGMFFADQNPGTTTI